MHFKCACMHAQWKGTKCGLSFVSTVKAMSWTVVYFNQHADAAHLFTSRNGSKTLQNDRISVHFNQMYYKC